MHARDRLAEVAAPVLLARNAPGDRDAARDTLTATVELFRTKGFHGFVGRAEALLASETTAMWLQRFRAGGVPSAFAIVPPIREPAMPSPSVQSSPIFCLPGSSRRASAPMIRPATMNPMIPMSP